MTALVSPSFLQGKGAYQPGFGLCRPHHTPLGYAPKPGETSRVAELRAVAWGTGLGLVEVGVEGRDGLGLMADKHQGAVELKGFVPGAGVAAK